MRNGERPLPLSNAALRYAPNNELGVVYLFATIAGRLGFRVEQVRAAYPDCVAYRRVGDAEKRVRIEFEFRSSSFRTHGHDPGRCDCVVCWHHDCPTIPLRIEVIELKKYFGVGFKVWIQPAKKSEQPQLDGRNRLTWALSTRASQGDLLLMYRGYPACEISDVFRLISPELWKGKAGWKEREAYFGKIERVCRLESPIFLGDLRNHKVLRTAPFMRKNMQGNHLASEYWPYLYTMICDRNARSRRILSRYAPDKF